MTTKQQAYEGIFALLDKEGLIDKTLSLGLKINIEGFGKEEFIFISKKQGIVKYFDGYEDINETQDYYIQKHIGHEPILSDLFEWFNKKGYATEYYCSELKIRRYGQMNNVTRINIKISKSLKDQEENTLIELYNLMK